MVKPSSMMWSVSASRPKFSTSTHTKRSSASVLLISEFLHLVVRDAPLLVIELSGLQSSDPTPLANSVRLHREDRSHLVHGEHRVVHAQLAHVFFSGIGATSK